jgi:HK97 family phage portal protein
MGRISDMLDRIQALIPERKVAVGATIQTWEDGTPQSPRGAYNQSYFNYAKDGYSTNEVVYACVEELSTSAAEPRIAACHLVNGKPEHIEGHPVVDLFEHPNPYTSRFTLIASLIMYRAVAGTAYLEKVRSASGKVVELWPLRPDRMWVIPDRDKHIRGWEYRLGAETFFLRPEDVIQFKTRNPLDDWYGLPPLAACAGRVDTDNFMRAFTGSFFRNAGVPAGLLTLTKQTTETERRLIQNRFRNETGGPGNWHSLLVLDDMAEAKYTPMGVPLGGSGLVMPDLEEITSSRIAMVYGVPLELIGARISMLHGNRTTMKEARATFWDETLSPIYQEMAADLTRGMAPEYADVDYLEFDLSTVGALQEDQDAKHNRIRADMLAGIISVQEARTKLGEEPEYDGDAILIMPSTLVAERADAVLNPPVPQAIPGVPAPGQNGNGHKPVDMAALRELAAGR